MIEILEFIFTDFKHYFGFIILILSTCLGLSWITNAFLPKSLIQYHIYDDGLDEMIDDEDTNNN